MHFEKNELLKKELISFVLCIPIFLFPILSTGIQSLSVICAALSSVVFYRHNFVNRVYNKKLWIQYFIITGFIWFTIISFFWSNDKATFLIELRPTISILVFPFVFLFFLPGVNLKNKEIVYFIFVLGMFVYTLLWFNFHVEGISIYQEKELFELPIRDLSLFDKLSYFKEKTYRGFVSGIANRGHVLTNGSDFFKHHTYISAFLNLAILFCVFLLKATQNRIIQISSIILLPLFLIFLLYLSSIVNIIFLFFTFIYGVFHLVGSKKISTYIVICAFGAGAFIANEKIIRLYKDLDKWSLFSKRYRSYEGRQVFDYLRYTLMICSKEQVKETPFFGIGLGDYQEYLTACISEKDIGNNIDIKQEYNSHSQYIHYFLVGGILNGILFLAFIGFFVVKAIKTKDAFFMLFLLLIICNMGFENFLNRIWGVLFIITFILIIPIWKEIPSATIND